MVMDQYIASGIGVGKTIRQITLTPQILVPSFPVASKSSPQLCSQLQISQFCNIQNTIRIQTIKGGKPGSMITTSKI